MNEERFENWKHPEIEDRKLHPKYRASSKLGLDPNLGTVPIGDFPHQSETEPRAGAFLPWNTVKPLEQVGKGFVRDPRSLVAHLENDATGRSRHGYPNQAGLPRVLDGVAD